MYLSKIRIVQLFGIWYFISFNIFNVFLNCVQRDESWARFKYLALASDELKCL